MKRLAVILLALGILLSMAACGMIQEELELAYAENYTIEGEVFEKYDKIIWESSDSSVAEVKGGVVSAKAPGEAEITATANDKQLAVYKVKVYTIPVSEIVLSTVKCELTEGESLQLRYSLYPADASDYGLTWRSTDPSVATVDPKGKIQAVAEGQAMISISNKDGFMATCAVTVSREKPNLKAVYDEYCDPEWASISSDGAYMTVDTNPKDRDDYTDYVAYFSLYSIHEALGLPESLIEKMGSTRALDGRQTQTYDMLTVSWSYHPDHGLEVIYEVN